MTRVLQKANKERPFDFNESRRGAALPHKGKVRVTIWLDEDVVAKFREQADAAGEGYQTRINRALRNEVFGDPLGAVVREAVRAEISALVGTSVVPAKTRKR
ncbi:CopG family transcriptional regulator [bacterium]|nr:MAG: CopG family transcriptional regulator [bacterium]